MQSDAKHFTDDWTGTETRAHIEVKKTPGGMGTTNHYATLVLERLILGYNPRPETVAAGLATAESPVFGSLSIRFGLHDLREWLRAALERVEEEYTNATPYTGVRPRGHGG